MRGKTTFLLTLGLFVAMAVSTNAALYEYLENPNNVAILGTAYGWGNAEFWYPGDPLPTNDASQVLDTGISVGEPGTADFDDYVHYGYSWPDPAGSAMPGETLVAGKYILEVKWDTAYNLTALNAYVASGDTIGTGGAIDADRTVSNVDFYVNYQPVGSDPVYTFAGSAVPGATDDVGGFDLTNVSGTWNGVTSVRYDFTTPTLYDAETNPYPQPRIAEVQAIAPGVTVNYPGPIELSGLTLVGEGGFDNADNLAVGATAFSTPVIADPDYPYEGGGDQWAAENVNNGSYGLPDWIGLSASPTLGKGFVGVNLGATTQEIGIVAFSENNLTGGFLERCWGEYEIQYTTVANPDENTPDASWVTIGTADYNRLVRDGETGYDDFQEPGKRHIFSFDPVMATGIRLVVPEVWEENSFAHSAFPNIDFSTTATSIDELEVYAPGKVFDFSPASPEGIAYTATGVTLVSEGGSYTENNIAMDAGAVAFGSSEHPAAVHSFAHANDGIYGNDNSWLSDLSATQQYIAIALAEETEVGSIAFSRWNAEDPFYKDRCLGGYTIQYTTVANPDATLTDEDWTDIGTLTYLLSPEDEGMTEFEESEFYLPYLRHLIEFDPVTATALRILISDPGMCIDEFEIYAATSPKVAGDANGDGKVDGSDVTILAGNWQKGVSDGQTAIWGDGDFNGDGKVDGSDVTILAGNWQHGVNPAAASVPEPSTIVLLLGVFASLAIIRRVK